MANEISNVEPPALPLAAEEYNRAISDENNNILRLFFNRLSTTVNTLLDPTDSGGKFIYFPRAAFYSTADQSAGSINTGVAVTFNVTSFSVGITLSNNSRINVTNSGTYFFDVTLQVENNNSSDTAVTVWQQKNGSAIAYSARRFDIIGSDDDVISLSFAHQLAAGDYIETYWATSNTSLNLHTETASSPHPGIPAAALSVVFQSNS